MIFNILQPKFTKKFPLKHIIFEITKSCNLKCIHCYNHWNCPEFAQKDDESYKKIIKVLNRLFDVSEVKTVGITGGEPFLVNRIEDVLSYLKKLNKPTTIISNGTLISLKQIEFLQKLEIGLIEISLHSVYPEVHDAITGIKGSWEKTVNTIKTMREHWLQLVPIIVLTKLNHEHIAETLRFMIELKLPVIMVNRYNIGGRGIENNPDILLSYDELNAAFRKINDVAPTFRQRITSNVCTPFCLLNPSDFPNIGFGSCGDNPMHRPITLEINGNLRMCNHSPIVMGNIFKDSMEDIFESDYVKSWATTNPEHCSDCSIYDRCKGGCRAASEQMGMSLNSVDPVVPYLNIKTKY